MTFLNKYATYALLGTLTVNIFTITPASAQENLLGQVVKRSGYDTLYYITQDGSRLSFPNEKTYKSWFRDFSNIPTVTDEELSNFPLTGNVRYRPGVLMVKIESDPRVYAVAKNGVLRWISHEEIAKNLYGDDWANFIDDIPAAFFTNYTEGEAIVLSSDYHALQASAEARTIEENRGLLRSNNITHRESDTNSCIIRNVLKCRQTRQNPVVENVLNVPAAGEQITEIKVAKDYTTLNAGVLWSNTNTYDVAIITPDGVEFTIQNADQYPFVKVQSNSLQEEDFNFETRYFSIQTPTPGTWKVRVRALETPEPETELSLIVHAGTPFEIAWDIPKYIYTGSQTPISLTLFYNGEPMPGATITGTGAAIDEATGEKNMQFSDVVYSDTSNNGTYAYTFPPFAARGIFFSNVSIIGVDPNGYPFELVSNAGNNPIVPIETAHIVGPKRFYFADSNTDNDEEVDYLKIEFEIEVVEQGYYSIDYQIVDANHQEITNDVAASYELDPGIHTITGTIPLGDLNNQRFLIDKEQYKVYNMRLVEHRYYSTADTLLDPGFIVYVE